MPNPIGTNKLQAAPTPKRAPRGRVNVNQEHIDEGIRKNSTHCAIAEAVKAAFPQATKVSVDLQTIRWSDKTKGFRYTYLTPPVAQQYLLLFDQGVKCRPFGFTLRGAQTSSVREIVRVDGKKKEKHRHHLGRKRLLPPNAGSPPEVYGGNAAPKFKGQGFSGRRRFGVQAFTGEDITERAK